MHKRHYAQRQHIIHSLNALCYQLHALSFFLSPSVWSLALRIISQLQCAKPRDIDATRSLRFFYAMLLLFNGPTLWNHATQGAAEGRAIVLDFVGMAYVPSKAQLIVLDLLIVFLQLLLTTIAYETSVWYTSSASAEDTLLPDTISPLPSSLPSPITSSPPPTPTNSSMRDEESNTTKMGSRTGVPQYVLDLRLRPIIARLRSPVPPPPSANSDSLLPLPNTTSWPLPAGMRMLMRGAGGRTREAGSATVAGVASAERTERERPIPGAMQSLD
ncbi:hypothetical protein BDQ12DRAFT_673535 [Crucibulum laeve]|uniref:DUF1746 domain-containing protein n=1 Tax=Crucibulum laeve TaxID=68775 RepID=A0A5C3MJ89_9AGAR|nr:hypothetical protein BDQ12DRAFT_673535 [Crucibulum laeve]